MKRSELEHLIRAASAVTLSDEFVILGSQALLAEHPDAPADLLVSIEADIYPRAHPEDSILIDGAIGEGSVFHHTFGYYAHGVGPETACLPRGWEERLVPLRGENTRGATGWCLETHDLAASKLAAGRSRDLAFVQGLLRHSLADPSTIADRISLLPLQGQDADRCRHRLARIRRD